ncbi:MAG: NAD(P)H-dependent oxidoreductase [Proteobacteria bacterium]|nr:NAD(P)H-dependent oxidoreductase [Pseudomonadota bacterium]
MNTRVLVVYFSRTGHTHQVAAAIANEVGADLEPILDRTRRMGVFGYLRSGFEAAFQRHVDIGAAEHDPATYDLVIVGTPIWNLAVSSPVLSYLQRHRDAFRAVAFFCTCGGMGAERVFAQMARAAGAKPAATLAVREADLGRAEVDIERFATSIETAVELTRPPIIRRNEPHARS